jgi:Tol biopolymer transport system component
MTTGSTWEIWAVRENGDPSTLHRVIPNEHFAGSPSSPTLSPDDKWLAFNKSDGVYVQPFDAGTATATGPAVRLTSAVSGMAGMVWGATWSSDGKSLALSAEPSRGSYADIFRIELIFDADGNITGASSPINLTKTPNNSEYDPDWSVATSAWPAGRVAYVDEQADILYHINPYPDRDANGDGAPDGTGRQLILKGKPGGKSMVSWSPRAEKIAFQAFSGQNRDLFSVAPNGSGLTNLTNTGKANEVRPAWKPEPPQTPQP